jgi:hypothetical protein
MVIIELKQWSKGVNLTRKDGIVNLDFYKNSDQPHPSYQAWSYTTLIEDYNKSIETHSIKLNPCAYLHNYQEDNILNNEFYKEYLEKAPIFYRTDIFKLQNFIKNHVKIGDRGKTLKIVDKGKIKPSKSLIKHVHSLLKGNKEFILIDDQKVVYEEIMEKSNYLNSEQKRIIVIEGGPGTGKSVIAINLLSKLLEKGLMASYVTKNSAPRAVFEKMLTGKETRSRISHLFKSSGNFYNVSKNTYDVLLVDEAHRLNEKGGIFNNLGENQIKELINASKLTVFFIDENQRVTLKDIGKKSEIYNWANFFDAEINIKKLESQFRCNGSDGYISWLDNTLQIRETANTSLEGFSYDFRIFDNVENLHKAIVEKNKLNNKSRVVAGYCWDWVSKKNSNVFDIKIGTYKAKWNLKEHGQSWIINKDSVSEIGCIHTSQGLELDYVGVIFGKDLIARNGKIETNYKSRAKTDQSLKGLKKIMKLDKELALKKADEIIKNTYRTLMTRGMKGCYVYFTDEETKEYFKNKINNSTKYVNSFNNYKKILKLTDN